MARIPMRVMPVRLPVEEVEAIKGWANIYGRDFSKEVRLAVRLHLRELMLAHLAHEEGREDVRAQGFDPEAEAEMMTASLEQLRAEAYGPRARTFTPSPLEEVAATS